MPTLGPQPGDDITPEEFKRCKCGRNLEYYTEDLSGECWPCFEARKAAEDEPGFFALLKAAFKKLARSPVQPGIITDRSGESRPGVKWSKKW